MGKWSDGTNGTDRAKCAYYTERKGSKIPENRQMERVTPPAPKKHRKPKLSMLFLLQKLCACEKVYADTHDNNKIYERDDGSNKQVSA